MNVDEHLLVSVLAAPFAILATLGSTPPVQFITAYSIAVAAGVLIDLDHFPIMRMETGNWNDLKKVVTNPKGVVTNFRNLTLFPLEKKYAGHLISMTAVVVATNLVTPTYTALVGLMLAIHLLLDLVASYQMKTFPFGDADPEAERRTLI